MTDSSGFKLTVRTLPSYASSVVRPPTPRIRTGIGLPGVVAHQAASMSTHS